MEAKPGNAISVIETDCEVDFAPPLDYVEPMREDVVMPDVPMAAGPSDQAPPADAAEGQPEAPGFAAFRGSAYRVDGKAVASTDGGGAGPLTGPPRPSSSASSASATSAASGRVAGKVVFGTGGNRLLSKKDGEKGPGGGAGAVNAKPSAEKKKSEEENDKQFQAFSGKGFSLKG